MSICGIIIHEHEKGIESLFRDKFRCVAFTLARAMSDLLMLKTVRKVVKGTRFAPASGTVRIGRLDVYSTLQDNDVSGNLVT